MFYAAIRFRDPQGDKIWINTTEIFFKKTHEIRVIGQQKKLHVFKPENQDDFDRNKYYASKFCTFSCDIALKNPTHKCGFCHCVILGLAGKKSEKFNLIKH